jgi:phosphate transport system permease protein
VTSLVIPNALPGIVTGVILAIGRAIGETAAVIFTAGSSLRLPQSLFDRSGRSRCTLPLARRGSPCATPTGPRRSLTAVLLVNFLAYYLVNRVSKRRSR